MTLGGIAARDVATADGTAVSATATDFGGVLTLTSEELTVLAERHQAVLPPALRPDLPAEQVAVAGRVAGRSLLARGLAQSDAAGLRLTPSARAWLAPILFADLSVEVTLAVPGGHESAHVVLGGAGRVAVLDEREPGVWVIARREVDPVTAVGALLDDGAPEGALTLRQGTEESTVRWTSGDDTDALGRLIALLVDT